MDPTRIDAEQLIPRYLAGQLSTAESRDLEAYWTQHPEIVKELEYTLRLKEGLAILRSRGELEPLLRRRSSPRWLMGAAAALLLLSVGFWGWRRPPLHAPAMAASRFELVGGDRDVLPVGGHYVLARDRGAAAAVSVQLPHERNVIELQVLPSDFAAGRPYWIDLARVDASGRRTVLRALDDVPAAEDRYVTVFVDSARLIPGRYELSLGAEPRVPGGGSDQFSLQMK